MIDIKGDKEIIARWRAAPAKMKQLMTEGMWDALRAVQALIPPYPPKPTKSKYVRTGNLARGIGTSMGGGAVGKPSIFEVKNSGGFIEGRMGSNKPEYNEFVIGENQAGHMGHWWTVLKLRDMAVRSVDFWKPIMSKIIDMLKG